MLKRVLVVDDDQQLLKIMELILREQFEVITYTSLFESLVEIKSGVQFDILVTDFNFEGEPIDGLDLVEVVRNLRPNVPIVLATGTSPEDERVRQFESIPNAQILKKPFTPWDLVHKVGLMLQLEEA